MRKILILIIALFVLMTPICAYAVEGVAEAEAPAEGATNVEVIAYYIKELAPELMSGASLIISLVIAWAFRKSLLPIVTKVLSAIKNSVDKYNSKADDLVAIITKKLNLSESFNKELLEQFTLQKEEMKIVGMVVKKALIAQSDSLCNLLENTNLPAHTKAVIAAEHKAQIDEICALLKGGGVDEN